RTVEESGVLDRLVDEASDDEASNVLMVGGRPVRLWHPSMAAFASAATHGVASSGDVVAPMQGTILKVLVTEGQAVEAGEAVLVLEAMKMETTIAAPRAGAITQLLVKPGDTAGAGQVLASVE
ncbi:MAG: acetyl-CoA/propionyl-CoA carboxylase, biotin carboxylase, biotin carboxyl carrier protein, partial [Actinomycetota bacterium]|nr:acetyl-CoA/propionyl-CoA carboxylase, biotin carboxylase, biotin carboxyl carrier protein [Actinomycetota bacterium]